MTKETIELFRKIILPRYQKALRITNHEGMGETDAKEFKRDFNEILDLATKALESRPRKGEWLRLSDLSEEEDNRYKCSYCGNVIRHSNKMDLYTFNSWCGRCGSDNGRHKPYKAESEPQETYCGYTDEERDHLWMYMIFNRDKIIEKTEEWGKEAEKKGMTLTEYLESIDPLDTNKEELPIWLGKNCKDCGNKKCKKLGTLPKGYDCALWQPKSEVEE